MLLSIKRDLLLKPLALLSGFVEKKQTMPMLSNVYIKKNQNELMLVANDLEMQAYVVVRDDIIGEDFTITLPGKKLLDILKVMPENVNVVLSQQESRITVKSGKLKFTVQSLPAEHYPLVKVADDLICEFTLEQTKLKQMIAQIQYAMAGKDTRVFLNGMLFEIKNNQLCLVATDAHRLGLVCCDLISEIKKPHKVIVPRKAVIELTKLLEYITDPVIVKVFNNQVHFETDDKQLITKVIDGKYPDYERVIPLGNDKLCLINRLRLLDAIDRVAVIGSEKVKVITIGLSANLLTLSCQNEEQEDSHDEMEIIYDNNAAITISFNLLYLRELLSNSNAEIMQFAFFDFQRSVLVTIPDLPDFKAVIMPLRM